MKIRDGNMHNDYKANLWRMKILIIDCAYATKCSRTGNLSAIQCKPDGYIILNSPNISNEMHTTLNQVSATFQNLYLVRLRKTEGGWRPEELPR